MPLSPEIQVGMLTGATALLTAAITGWLDHFRATRRTSRDRARGAFGRLSALRYKSEILAWNSREARIKAEEFRAKGLTAQYDSKYAEDMELRRQLLDARAELQEVLATLELEARFDAEQRQLADQIRDYRSLIPVMEDPIALDKYSAWAEEYRRRLLSHFTDGFLQPLDSLISRIRSRLP